MALEVEIDKYSGFCGGVIRAISRAERFLAASPGRRLYSLGAIVHNEAELKRLGEKGLVTVTLEDLRGIENPGSETLLIRAHGEPPETYSYAESIGINLIDCTCPVVLKLQKSIREAWERLHPQGGQVIIFGKVGHAEVLGLLGQVGGDAVVVEDLGMLLEALPRVLLNIPEYATSFPVGRKPVSRCTGLSVPRWHPDTNSFRNSPPHMT